MIYNIKGKKVYAQKVNGSLWFYVDGEIYQHIDKSSMSSSSKKETDPNKISAPMPGKIIKVSVADGAMVNEGDILVIMEAMKMEYKLTAARSGAVSVLCKEGDTVSLGQDLALFSEENK